LYYGKPNIFNTDQGVQFTSEIFTGILLANGIKISMDARGRAFDNIFIERLWRTVKYEGVYLRDYESLRDAKINLEKFFRYYRAASPRIRLQKTGGVYFNNLTAKPSSYSPKKKMLYPPHKQHCENKRPTRPKQSKQFNSNIVQ